MGLAAAAPEGRRKGNYQRHRPETARLCLVLANGAGKAEPVRRALKDPIDIVSTPIQLAREGVWFLDPAAAASLAQ